MHIRRLLATACSTIAPWVAQAQPIEGCPSSSSLAARFDGFGRTGKMPPALGQWIGDAKAQAVEPFKTFDNVDYSARKSDGTPRPWKMLEPDVVVKDGDTIAVGDATFRVFETPGHTFGTASYEYVVRDGERRPEPVTVHLTTHPFSNGLFEAARGIPGRTVGEPHPLVDPADFASQLRALREGA